MSPVKIAIATFVVSLIGLAASATNEEGSSSRSGDYGLGYARIKNSKGKYYKHPYKPVSEDIEMKDVVEAISVDKLAAYKQALTKLHMYDNGRKDYKANGDERKDKLDRVLLQRQIDEFEREARKRKLEIGEAEQARARKKQYDELADRLYGSQAEEEQLDLERYGARAEEVYSEYAEQLNGAQAEQLNGAQAEQLDGGQFGEDTPVYSNSSGVQ